MPKASKFKATQSVPVYSTAGGTKGPQRAKVSRQRRNQNRLIASGVIIYYQCSEGCPDIVKGLNEIVEPYIKAGRKVILAPNDPTWTIGSSQPLHKEMGKRIAVSAWQRLLTMDEVDSQQIRTFIERYEGVDHHNG